MRFSTLLFLIPLVHAEPCTPSIRPLHESKISLPPCHIQPYLRSPFIPKRKIKMRKEIMVTPKKKEDDEDDEYIDEMVMID